MRTLILRTFAHSNIWEGLEESCHFEYTQKDQILEWEPDFLSFSKDDFDYALGIYIDKYFTGYYEPLTTIHKIANTGSINEQIISKLKLLGDDKGLLSKFLNNRIYISIQVEAKLWNKPNKDLMLKIDNALLEEMMKEIKKKGIVIKNSTFKPLAFSLDSNTVKNILNTYTN